MALRRLFLLTFLFLLAFVSLLFAQESGPFNWGTLGVDMVVIGSIITIVQFFKKYIPVKLVVFAPVLLSVIAFFVVPGDRPIPEVFAWAAAAAYTWKMLNAVTPEKVLKSKSLIE